jgi:hypothetical protein
MNFCRLVLCVSKAGREPRLLVVYWHRVVLPAPAISWLDLLYNFDSLLR